MEYVEGENVVIFDFNNLAIRTYFGDKDILGEEPRWGLWKYNVFNAVYNALWKTNASEVILAIDDKHTWRKSKYPRYKESRQKTKKESKHDWEEIYLHMDSFAAELKHCMPFKVIKVANSEADDIIAVLVKKLKTPCLIVSGDEDFNQLLINDDIKIYDPYSKEFHTNKTVNAKEFLLEKIFCGQKKDDIPNILTPDDWGMTDKTKGVNRPGFGIKKWESIKSDYMTFLNTPYENKIYGKIDLKYNLHRNRTLIDFDKIPDSIVCKITEAYNMYTHFPPVENIYLFFEKNAMRSFLQDVHRVESKLVRLLK
jgi:hypothetical protein